MTLKDGSEPVDPRLDRLIQFDERSRDYPIRPLRTIEEVTKPAFRSYTWRMAKPYVLDQGSEGACVGFAITNELIARPAEVTFGGMYRALVFAVQHIYWEAQKIDPWPGGAYPGASPFYEGTSLLAGVKTAHALRYFDSYRWAFGLEDLVYGLGHHGPAVLGVNWYSGMYAPKDNFIRPVGTVVGGHAILARGVKLVWKHHRFTPWKRRYEDLDFDESYVILRNSWGPDYGDKGDCYITLTDLDSLLRQQGEAVFFVGRRTNP
jgi:hypothetical protein